MSSRGANIYRFLLYMIEEPSSIPLNPSPPPKLTETETSEDLPYSPQKKRYLDILSKYKYIDKDELSQNFDLCIPTDSSAPLKLKFVMYSINTSCYIEGIPESKKETQNLSDVMFLYNTVYPFLQFVTEYRKENESSVEEYHFPMMEYTCPIPNKPFGETRNVFGFFKGGEPPMPSDESKDPSEGEPGEKSQSQIHFETECFKFLFSLFEKIEDVHLQELDIFTFYKGFLQNEENPRELYVFYDITFLVEFLKKKYTLAIIDELVYKTTIFEKPVNSSIVRLFDKNDYLTKVYTTNGNSFPFPFQTYLCKNSSDITTPVRYVNVEKSDTSNDQMIEHSFYGPAFYFTGDPIQKTKVENLKRFSCFIVRCLYLLQDIEIDEIKEEDFKEYQKSKIAASTFYFHENGVQMWGIKNILHFVEY